MTPTKRTVSARDDGDDDPLPNPPIDTIADQLGTSERPAKRTRRETAAGDPQMTRDHAEGQSHRQRQHLPGNTDPTNRSTGSVAEVSDLSTPATTATAVDSLADPARPAVARRRRSARKPRPKAPVAVSTDVDVQARFDLTPDGSSFILFGRLPADLWMADSEFEEAWALHPDERGTYRDPITRKVISVQRWHQAYGRDYHFARDNHAAAPMPDLVAPYLEWAKGAFDGCSTLNSALVNWYEAEDYVGAHADETKHLVHRSPIVSLTFGSSKRVFHMRPKKSCPEGARVNVAMHANTYIVMCGATQETHKHAVAKISGRNTVGVGRRVNYTFRSFVEKPPPNNLP